MSHGITSEDGMASGKGIMPWHGLGEVMPDRNMTSQEALELAKLDWEVDTEPMFLNNGKQIPQAKAIVRRDTERILGVVGEAYKPVQNREAFSFLDELLFGGSSDDAYIETCGSLHGGAVVWIMVALNDVLAIAGQDVIQPYLLFTNRNTGRRAVELSQVNVRVVCANTLSMAENERNATKLRIRHVNGLIESVDKARELVGIAKQNNLTMKELFERMADTSASHDAVDALLADLIPGNPLAEAHVQARTQTFRDRILNLAEWGVGNEQYQGTWWAVYNGITEWADHHKQVSRGPVEKASTMSAEETRLISNWSGPSSKLKVKALDAIAALLDSSPSIHDVAKYEPRIVGAKQRQLAKATGTTVLEPYVPAEKLEKNMTIKEKVERGLWTQEQADEYLKNIRTPPKQPTKETVIADTFDELIGKLDLENVMTDSQHQQAIEHAQHVAHVLRSGKIPINIANWPKKESKRMIEAVKANLDSLPAVTPKKKGKKDKEAEAVEVATA